jgi:hypothetical protein
LVSKKFSHFQSGAQTVEGKQIQLLGEKRSAQRRWKNQLVELCLSFSLIMTEAARDSLKSYKLGRVLKGWQIERRKKLLISTCFRFDFLFV